MGVDHLPTQFKYRHDLYKLFRDRAAMTLEYEQSTLNKDFKEAFSRYAGSRNEDVTVLIIQRLDDRSFSTEALEKMVYIIKANYRNAFVVIRSFDNSTLEEQAQLMQNTSVMIAVDGAAVDNALFMPDCTGLLVIGRDTLRPISYDLSHGFTMHETHFSLWQQRLAIELISTVPGTWMDILPNGKASGPLGTLPYDKQVQLQFEQHFLNLMQKRRLCATRYYLSEPPTSLSWIAEVGKPLASRRTQVCPLSASDGDVCCFQKSTTSWETSCYPHVHDSNLLACGRRANLSTSRDSHIFIKRRRYLPIYDRLRTIENASLENWDSAIIRVELKATRSAGFRVDDIIWYEFYDHSTYRFRSSSAFLNDLYDIVNPFAVELFLQKKVLVYNSADLFVPIWALHKGALKVDVGIPQDNEAVAIAAKVLGKLMPTFADTCSDGGSVFGSANSLPEGLADTVIALVSLHDIMYCDESIAGRPSNNFSYSAVIAALAKHTNAYLLIEFHPGQDDDTNFCPNCILPDVEKLETALREYFETFKVIGSINGGTLSGTLFYLAQNPIREIVRGIIQQSEQGIILIPQDGDVFQLVDNVATITIQGIISGPSARLKELHEYVKQILMTEGNTQKTEAKQPYLMPRLLLDQEMQDISNISLSVIGNNLFFSYSFDVRSKGDHIITFQVLKNVFIKLKSQFGVPEVVAQQSISIKVMHESSINVGARQL